MLRSAARLIVAIVVSNPIVLFSAAAAQADGGIGSVICDKTNPQPGCDVTAGSGGQSGGSLSGGNDGGKDGAGKCRSQAGKEIPCEREGGWAGADGCYYQPTDPPPAVIDGLGGQPAGKGGWYLRVCYNDGATTGGLGGAVWIPGAVPVVSPEVLARQARERLNLPDVVIRLNPAGDQLVNLPVWLALNRSSWRPQSATASAGAISVTATALPVEVAWSMGDGTIRTCGGPGTTWKPGTDPKAASPDCGHVYRRSSTGAANGAYVVSATVTWEVTWAGAGQTGTVPGLETTGQVQTRVQESQAVISR